MASCRPAITAARSSNGSTRPPSSSITSSTGLQQTTLGGKQVLGAGAFGAYVYVKGDVMFYILAIGNPDFAAAALRQLP